MFEKSVRIYKTALGAEDPLVAAALGHFGRHCYMQVRM